MHLKVFSNHAKKSGKNTKITLWKFGNNYDDYTKKMVEKAILSLLWINKCTLFTVTFCEGEARVLRSQPKYNT